MTTITVQCYGKSGTGTSKLANPDMDNTFENYDVGFILSQASMIFWTVAKYPHYDIAEDGTLKRSHKPNEIRTMAGETHDAIFKIIDKRRRNVRIPKTLINKVKESDTLVAALMQCKATTREWAEHYFRALRYFNCPSIIEDQALGD